MRGLSDLNVGDQFESPTLTVDKDEVLAFAQRFDPQPFHLDEVAARQSLFKGLAASGWHTAAMCFRLIHDSGLDLRGGIIGQKIEELRWPRPVRPGDRLRVVTTVADVRRSDKHPQRGIVVFDHVALNQHDEPVLHMRAQVLASDPAPEAEGH
jgi:acyl dehydratase